MKQGLWVLAALVAGLLAGAGVRAAGLPALTDAAGLATLMGTLWLDALRMTLMPLIFALLVAAIAGMSEAVAAGRLARRALALFAGLIVAAALYALAATGAVLSVWPVSPEAAQVLMTGVGGGAAAAPAAPVDLGGWLASLIPANVVAAAAEDAVLPVVVFACVFGFAVTRLPAERRAPLTGFFQAAADAMIVIVQWVLALAPFGVFGLSLSLGLSTGLQSVGVLGQYVAIVSGVIIGLIVLLVAGGWLASGLPVGVWLRGLAPVQVVAASTQSSLATLPAMLQASMGPLGVRPRVAEMVLPMAVAMFRATSPVGNLAVALFCAHVAGVAPGPAQLAAAVAVAFAVSVSSVGLPGQSSFFASVAPICLALGVPVTLLPLLLAVEVIPDVFRTIGNVTADVAVTRALDRAEGKDPDDTA